MPLPSPPDQFRPRISCVSNMVEWRKLAEEWTELVSNSTADAIFLSWPWLDTWMSVYGDGGQWQVLVARDPVNNRLLGVAPMMLDRGTGHVGRWLRRLILVGQKADTASEYLDWILRAGHEKEVVGSFCDHLFNDRSSQWDMLCFGAMRADSLTIPLLKHEFAARGIGLDINASTTAPFLKLPATWPAFLESRRAKFRQRLNKFQRDHSVVVRLGGRDMSVAQGMAKLRELNEHRWGEKRRSFLSERYMRFHHRVAERLHDLGHLLLIFLEVDGTIIAGRYDFVYAGKAWSFQGGWLPEWEKESAGKVMLTEIMRWCIEHGLGEYDFLGGEASYKNEWGNGERQIVDIQAANPRSVRGRLFEVLKRRLKEPRARKNGTADHPEPS